MVRSTALKILCYHSVDDTDSLVSISPSRFAEQMESLKRRGYAGTSLGEAFRRQVDGPRGRSRVAITFDDGYQSFYTHVFPVLKDLGFNATVFLVSSCMGGSPTWIRRDFGSVLPLPGSGDPLAREFLAQAKTLFATRMPYFSTLPEPDLRSVVDRLDKASALPLMSWETARELAGRGVEFGAHTATHPFLTESTESEAREEISSSRSEIEERLGEPVEFFCYPYGAWDPRVRKIVRDLEFTGACTTDIGSNEPSGECSHSLKRFSIDTTVSRLKFRLYVSAFDRLYFWLRRCGTRLKTTSTAVLDIC